MSINDLEAIYEDDYLIVFNKPSNLLVHHKNIRDSEVTLEDLIKQKFPKAILLHRLDRLTSGLVMFAKNKDPIFQELFSKKKIRKSYLVLVEGTWDKKINKIETWIGKGQNFSSETQDTKYALTTFRVLKNIGNNTLLEALPKTGRTHQIRLHCKFVNHPVVGDVLYGAKKLYEDSIGLHAWKLKFIHPILKNEIQLQADFKINKSLKEIWEA